MVQTRCPRTVGRDAELEFLRRALNRTLAGSGEMVVLVGPAGIGKSRLVAELLEQAEGAGVPAVVGRATSTDGSMAFRPLTQALLQLLGPRSFPDTDGDLAVWRAPLTAVLPTLSTGAAPVECSADLRAEAVLQLLRRTTDPAAVIVLEDLHWADPDTLAVLDYIADSVRAQPILWVATFRSEAADDPAAELLDRMRGRRGVETLTLARLTTGEVVEMVQACRPDASSELVERIRRHSDGLPLFVEQIACSPGVPPSFERAVNEQLAGLAETTVRVLQAAAVVGSPSRPDVLAKMTALTPDRIEAELADAGMGALVVRDAQGVRFRHSLTREVLLDTVPSAVRRDLARAALETLSDEHSPLAADLAEQAGDPHRAGRIVAEQGRIAFRDGALGTAVSALCRANLLLAGSRAAVDVQLTLIQALTAAGRVDEAMSEGSALVAELERDGSAVGTAELAGVHLLLAEAAARAARWGLAKSHLMFVGNAPALAERAAVLGAEVSFATDQVDVARGKVAVLLSAGITDSDLECRVLGLAGRLERLWDLNAARESFERMLAVAHGARLPVRALDALHELGTIELLEHGGTQRLIEARGLAEQHGALGTAAVLDLQLAAAYLSRFDTDAAERHGESAREMGQALGLAAVVAKALCGLAETRVQRRDAPGMEHFLALATAAAPEDVFLPAFGWGQCRGMLALLEGDWNGALECMERGISLLAPVFNPEPVEYRALWPLLLARAGAPRAAQALAAADTADLTALFANRGLLGYAAAILAGRRGDKIRARELALGADAYLVRFPVWSDIARLLAADACGADGWADPRSWLLGAPERFEAHRLVPLARCSRRYLEDADGITKREREVLDLLTQGLPYKQIGDRLHVSPRTVEKHVESLKRKTGRQSRTELAVWASMGKTP